MSRTQKEILSATLKAETVRIRHLRGEANRQLAFARKAKTGAHKNDHYPLVWSLRAAALCPSRRARCANLALGFLRGTPYREIEPFTRTPESVLYGSLAKEIAAKANATPGEIVDWMRVAFDVEAWRADQKALAVKHTEAKRAAREKATHTKRVA